jgi:predicted RNA-binding Zn ribbon-like protein
METTVARSPLADLRIVGGNLALDFVNTRSGPRHGPVDAEWLSSYADFAAWSRRVADPGRDLPSQPAAGPAGVDAVAAFARVLACRDDLDEIFRPLADGQAPLDAALRRLQLTYVEALAHGRLAAVDPEGYAWAWEPAGDLLAPLWPVVAAAVELLTARPAERVKGCQACRFLFLDQSKNGSRRWCSMDDCGKAAKIARYLQRRSDAQAR